MKGVTHNNNAFRERVDRRDRIPISITKMNLEEFEDAMDTWGHNVFDALVDLPDMQEIAEEGEPTCQDADWPGQLGSATYPTGSVKDDVYISGQVKSSASGHANPTAATNQQDHAAAGDMASGVVEECAATELKCSGVGGRFPAAAVTAARTEAINISGRRSQETEGLLDAKIQRAFKGLWAPQHILLMVKLSFLLGCTLLWCVIESSCHPF